MPERATGARKAEHLRINVERDVRSKGVTNGFEAYRLIHRALPEIDLDAVDTCTTFLGRTLSAPFLISCMTGGTPAARRINRRLARVAQQAGFAMGLGSARALLEDPAHLASFDVRALAPDVPLLANLGAVQLNYGYTAERCARLVATLGADALVLHLNPLQEALQPEGDTRFAGLLTAIGDLVRALPVPVVVKEVGWGIGPHAVRALAAAGVAAIDVAGAGGTSWSEVERHRIGTPWRARVAAAFAGWGIPTARALADARTAAPQAVLIASGGIAGGIDAAKALALGADLVGIAGPFLRAADAGSRPAETLARELVAVLRIAMFCCGAPNLRALRDCIEPA